MGWRGLRSTVMWKTSGRPSWPATSRRRRRNERDGGFSRTTVYNSIVVIGTKTRGGGPKNYDRADLVGGLLECVCGRQLRNDGTFADGRHRKHHPKPREAWGCKARLGDQTWEAPVLAQVAGIALDDATMASVVAALGPSHQPVEIARIERQIRELALEYAAGGLGDEAYLTRMKALREARDAVTERTAQGVPGQRAIDWLRTLGESLKAADVPQERQTCCTRSMSAWWSRATLRQCPPHTGRLQAWTGPRAAGCSYGAPDRS
jgi:hypothetical protein